MPIVALGAIARHVQEQIDQLVYEMQRSGTIHDVVTIRVTCPHWQATVVAHHHSTESLDGWRIGSSITHTVDLSADKSTAVRGVTPDKLNLREVERAILESLRGHDWQTVGQAAIRAGYVPNSYFRAAIARLVRFGLVIRSRHKLRLNDEK